MSLEHHPARAGDAPGGHPKAEAQEPDRLIGLREVMRLTSLSRTSIWRRERDGQFVRRRRCGPNRVAWILSEVQSWIREREPVT